MRPTILVSPLVCFAMLAKTFPAEACGGLFCSALNPVNQAAERIIFAQDEGRVHAVIEIQYQGPSSSFAWVLPVPGGETVEVGVSSKQALDALQRATNPQYNFNTTFEQCPFDDDAADDDAPSEDTAGDDDVSPEPEAEPDSVEVVLSGSVGPYDYVQLAVDESLPNVVDVVIDWLEENDYDVANLGIDRLEPYLESGLDLLAFRLTKGTDTGSIRPIALSWAGEYPVIPIRPTAVAANDDMGVLVWVLGPARAVPTNYVHLELNEAKINWFNPNATYNQVIIAAADEAGGQGFVTEQSTKAELLRSAIVPANLEYEFDRLLNNEFLTLQAFFESVVSFGGFYDPATYDGAFYDGFLDTLSDADLLPLREGATVEQFVACVSCYFETDVLVRNDAYPSTPFDPETDPILQVNVSAFLDGLQENVIKPMRETRALFQSERTVTRFYTTLSAEEMTLDPAFDFNPDLEPVDNVHSADRFIRCNGSQSITLPQGFVVEAQDGFTWPVTVDDALPMNHQILQLSLSGPGEVVIDNHARIVEKLSELDIGAAPPEDSGPGDDTPAENPSPDSDGPASEDPNYDDGPTNGDVSEGTVDRDATGEGCRCAVPGRHRTPSSLLWLTAAAVAAAVGRRKGR